MPLHRLATFGLSALVLTVSSSLASAQGSYPARYKTLGSYEGYSLAGAVLEESRTSVALSWAGLGYQEVDASARGAHRLLESKISVRSGQWNVSCWTTAFSSELACDLQSTDQERYFFVMPKNQKLGLLLDGRTGERVMMAGHGFSALNANLDSDTRTFGFRRAADGSSLATWKTEIRLGLPQILRVTSPARPKELEIISVLLLGMARTWDGNFGENSLSQVQPLALDGYLVKHRAAFPLPITNQLLRGLEGLMQRGFTEHAKLVRLLLTQAEFEIDQSAGPLVKRKPYTPRLATGLRFGSAFRSQTDGELGELGGFDATMQGLVRLNKTYLGVELGFGSAAAGLDIPGLRSTQFSLGLRAHQVVPIAFDAELVLGGTVTGHARFIEKSLSQDSLDSELQLGVSLAPVVGLQWSAWNINNLGSRLVLFVEAAPTWSWWTTPDEASNDLGPAVNDVLDARQFTISTSAGFRFEL